MAAGWGLLVALCAVAAQTTAYVQPSLFGSYHALSPRAVSDRRPTRSVAETPVRVINGKDARPGQFPHQVGLYVDMATFCGGALIAPKWILTAATCAGTNSRARYTAFLGAQNINLPAEKDRLVVTTTQSYVHPDFDAQMYKNDVGLILLPRDVKTTNYIKVVNLPPKSYASLTFAGDKFQLSGWGYVSDSSATISPSLRYVDLAGVEKKKCVETYGYEIYTDNILCCVGDNKQSPCQGDTGGGLVKTESDGSLTHIAIASFTPGKGCSTGLPSGFTRTASYLDWISKQTDITIKN